MFTWPAADAAPGALTELVEAVSWLGSSRSPVACAVVNDSIAPMFVPSSRGEHQIRVAAPGITEALLGARFIHPQPVPTAIAGYERWGTQPPGEAIATRGPFAELLVRRVVRATQDAADTPLLGDALRAAVLARPRRTRHPRCMAMTPVAVMRPT
jgi:hypothetical protein